LVIQKLTMRKGKYLLFQFIFLTIGITYLNAQIPQDYQYCSITKLSQDEGLSQGSNYFTFEDSEGFMWITANDAMNRYDGKMVKVYKKDFYFKNCEPLKQGYGIVEDSFKNIYVGSTDGLYIYNRGQDRFTMQKIFVNAIDNNTIPFAFKDNKIWCYNRQYNIASYDVITKKINYHSSLKMESLQSMHSYLNYATNYFYRQPFFDSGGLLWVSNSTALASYNISKNEASYHLVDYLNTKNLTLMCSYYSSKINCVLFGTEKGILKYNLRTHQIELIEKINDKKLKNVLELNYFNKNFIFKLGDNSFFVCNESFNEILSFIIGSDTFKTRNYLNLKPDKSNRLWVCDNGGGLVIYDFNKKTFFNENGNLDGEEYFYKSGINGFAEIEPNEILIRAGSKLFKQDKTTKKISLIFKESSNVNTFLSPDYDKNGFWYYNQESIIHYNKNYQILVNAQTDEALYGVVQDMVEIKKGVLLIAFSKGIFLFDVSKNKMVAIVNLLNKNPFKISLLSKDRLAISYLNGDMLLASSEENNNIFFQQKILPTIHTFYVEEDTEKKQFWVATDNGLYLLDSKFSMIKKIDANDDLAGTYIYGLLSDAVGNIWCSHEKGISSINKNTHEVTNYVMQDGIQGWDYNNRSFYKDIDGILYFGGVNGYNYFTPPVKRPVFYKPEIYVNEILINNKPFLADTNFNYISSINLSASNNNLSFHTIIKDLSGSAENEISYRFKGRDDFWNVLPNNSNIVFNSLSPGKYLLEIGVHNINTKNNISQKIISINIIPAFYQTTLFFILLAIAITSLLIWLYSRWHFAKQKRVFENQLSIEEERNRITADLHDDIGSTLSSLQVYSTVATQLIDNDKEKTKILLAKISSQSIKLLDNIGDIIWSMKPDNEQFISVSSRIKNFVSDIFTAADIDYTIQVDNTIDNHTNNITAKKNILLIIKEAVNNCVKYSKASHVKIFVKEINKNLEIEISDNGIGLANLEMRNGNGLRNMKKRTEELDGVFQLISFPKEGTSIICKIPLTSIRDNNL
jgi:signal transduction histidine kinase/ligand-binding sensor domain-containing protein